MSKALEGCESWDQVLDVLRTDEEEILQGGGCDRPEQSPRCP